MKLFKKSKIIIFVAIVGIMSVVTPVSAASKFKDDRPTFTQPLNFEKRYHTKQSQAILNQCRISNPSNYFLDTYIQEEAQRYINRGYYVGDLRALTEFGVAYQLCDKNLAFNYGFFVLDLNVYICKCSKSDYSRFCKFLKLDDKTKNNYYFSVMDVEGTISDIQYNPDTEVLKIQTKR